MQHTAINDFMRQRISELIKQSYSISEASRYLEYKSLKEGDGVDEIIIEEGKDILRNFPLIPKCCALMSAMWTAKIRDQTSIPVHMAAGSLDIGGHRIFGSDRDIHSIKSVFSQSNLDWDGHCWVVFGDYIGDISLFRTAYSQEAAVSLRDMVCNQFGKGRGMLLATPNGMLKEGLVYTPHYIVADSEITGLIKSLPFILQHYT